MINTSFKAFAFVLIVALFLGCNNPDQPQATEANDRTSANAEKKEYFNLRPEAEKAYGYSHAVKIGADIKISGAVSMDSAGMPTAKGDLLQQMKNCYADLDKVLKHYGCTFDDVVVENIFTTNMPEFLKHSAFRNSIYKKAIPNRLLAGRKRTGLTRVYDRNRIRGL